jgi:hypothetical protein
MSSMSNTRDDVQYYFNFFLSSKRSPLFAPTWFVVQYKSKRSPFFAPTWFVVHTKRNSNIIIKDYEHIAIVSKES